jgi:hypothetical protein
MRNITGPPVGGDDFFGREKELARLRSAVEDGNHVLLSAPRRVGKSSLVGKLGDVLKAANWRVAMADVQAAEDEVQFVQTLIASLQAAGLKITWFAWFEEWIQRGHDLVKGKRREKSADWKEVGDKIEDLLRDAAKKREPLLVIMDELPIFLAKLDKEEDGPQRVAHVLRWLRAARHAGLPSVRWVVCGSIGLDSFVEARGLAGTVNDFKAQTLGPFDEPGAVRCLQLLGSNPKYDMPLSEEACRLVLERLGWPLPYFLQLMFDALREVRNDGHKGPAFPTTADVEAAFQLLLNPQQVLKFSHWDTRLEDQFADPADAGVARLLLKRICRHPQGIARDALQADLVARRPNADLDLLERRLRDILLLLERDGYLIRQGDDYAFRSFLLRAYWERRFA